DKLDKESDEEEVLAAGEDMDEDPQVAEDVRTPSPKQDQPKPSHEHHEEAAISYADLKASIEEYYDENVAQRDQTDKLVESTMSTINKSSTAIKDLYQGLDVINKLLKDINTADLSLVNDFDFSTLQSTLKDLQAYAFKQKEVSAAWTKSSTNMDWNLGSRMTAIEISQTALKRQSSSTPLSSVTLTLALTNIPANIKGENATNTATQEPPSHTEGETEDPKMAIQLTSIQPTKVPPTQAKPITTITTYPESSQEAPRIDKGKGIATE
nr:hypothetical protein [Tanacetum cinerariifolium]